MHEIHSKTDRRVTRTIESLRRTLIELIIEKHYDSITIQDIIDRANVGRSTFYTYFRDKDDLLIGDWKRFLGLLIQHINVDGDEAKLAPLDGLMLHLKDYHAFYRGLVRSGKTERLFNLGTEYLASGIEEKIKASITDHRELSVPPAICAHYLALQIFGMLKYWLDHNMPYAPDEMDRMFHTLVAPGMLNVLDNSRSENVRV